VTAFWLGWRDVAMRPGRAALAILLVAACAAVFAAMELVERARDAAVAAQIDRMGAPLKVVPERGADESGRPALLPASHAALIQASAGAVVRDVEPWVTFEGEVQGTRARVMGAPPGSSVARSLGQGRVAVGAALAARLGVAPGSRISVTGRHHIAIILPEAGDADDAAVFVPLTVAQAALGAGDAVSELRIRLWPEAPVKESQELLRRILSGVSVLRVDRGAVADAEIAGALSAHHRGVLIVTAAVAVLCLAIVALLDASERRLELAALAALGARRRDLALALSSRSAVIGALGAAAGIVVGAAVAASIGEAVAVARAVGPLLGLALVVAMLLGALAAVPSAILASTREPVRDLQESAV
jgi:hypothetical protein